MPYLKHDASPCSERDNRACLLMVGKGQLQQVIKVWQLTPAPTYQRTVIHRGKVAVGRSSYRVLPSSLLKCFVQVCRHSEPQTKQIHHEGTSYPSSKDQMPDGY